MGIFKDIRDAAALDDAQPAVDLPPGEDQCGDDRTGEDQCGEDRTGDDQCGDDQCGDDRDGLQSAPGGGDGERGGGPRRPSQRGMRTSCD